MKTKLGNAYNPHIFSPIVNTHTHTHTHRKNTCMTHFLHTPHRLATLKVSSSYPTHTQIYVSLIFTHTHRHTHTHTHTLTDGVMIVLTLEVSSCPSPPPRWSHGTQHRQKNRHPVCNLNIIKPVLSFSTYTYVRYDHSCRPRLSVRGI